MLSDAAELRVLIVDDQEHVRTWVRAVLTSVGVTDIAEAADGSEAVAAVTQPGGWFDIVLCDLRMPERDGIETLRAFAALGVQSGVAIMSGEDERVLDTAALLTEAHGLRLLGTIQKPITVEKLEKLLARLRSRNYEFERAERLAGNIGYLKLNAFVDAERGGSVAAGAMAFLINTDALIIDLRDNGGGEPSMVGLLASYFFSGSVHLSSLAYRIEGTKDYDITQIWTSPYLSGHSAGVAELAGAAAGLCGFGDAEVRAVCRAGQLHDLGRVAVHPLVWEQPGELTADDWEQAELWAFPRKRRGRAVTPACDHRSVRTVDRGGG